MGIPNVPAPSSDKTVDQPGIGEIVCGELLVSFAEGTCAENAVSSLVPYGTIVGRLPTLFSYQLRVPSRCLPGDLDEVMNNLNSVLGVTDVRFNRITPATFTASPSDYYYTHGNQNELKAVGIDQVWEKYTTGSDGAEIAVVDTGVNYVHQDLGLVGTDGGRVLRGASISTIFGTVSSGADPLPDMYLPLLNPHPEHGTAVAGVIGAKANNNGDCEAEDPSRCGGIVGVTWKNPILAIKAYGTSYAIIAGIAAAVDSPAKIINISQSQEHCVAAGDVNDYQAVVERAIGAKKLVVAAAGNAPLGCPMNGPGGVAGALSVGALSKDGTRIATFSNYGQSVDVYAPGEDIATTVSFIQKKKRFVKD